MRYVYIANIGLMVALTQAFAYFPWMVPMTAAWYYSGLRQLMPMYQSDWWLTQHQVLFAPEYAYSWVLHGNMHFVRGQFNAALLDYNEAISRDPSSFKANFNLTSAYIAVNKPNEAWEQLEKCRSLEIAGQEVEKEIMIGRREDMLNDIKDATKNHKILHFTIQDIPILV
jgi:tetratricopeptide (TPR) repeat protein